MKATLRSDSGPDVLIECNECVNVLYMLDQHIRTLQSARRWLAREKAAKRERDRVARKARVSK